MWQKGPVFRVASAVLSISSSGGQPNRRGNLVLDEAKAPLLLGSSLGIDFGGKE
mgnify:CR=1 FL=1